MTKCENKQYVSHIEMENNITCTNIIFLKINVIKMKILFSYFKLSFRFKFTRSEPFMLSIPWKKCMLC